MYEEGNKAKRETKEILKALMDDMERIEPSTEDGENIKRTCICMVLEYMEGENETKAVETPDECEYYNEDENECGASFEHKCPFKDVGGVYYINGAPYRNVYCNKPRKGEE